MDTNEHGSGKMSFRLLPASRGLEFRRIAHVDPDVGRAGSGFTGDGNPISRDLLTQLRAFHQGQAARRAAGVENTLPP
jgi:hypothetical protein